MASIDDVVACSEKNVCIMTKSQSLPRQRHRLGPDGDEPERRAAALEAVQVVEHRPRAGRAVVVEHEAVGPQLPQQS